MRKEAIVLRRGIHSESKKKSPVLTALYHSDGLNTSLYTPCSPNKNNPTHAIIASISVSNGYLRYVLLKPCKYCPSCGVDLLSPSFHLPGSLSTCLFLSLGSHLPLINLLLHFYGACSRLWITSGYLGRILGWKPFLLPITKMFWTVVYSECSLLLLLRDHRPPYPS